MISPESIEELARSTLMRQLRRVVAGRAGWRTGNTPASAFRPVRAEGTQIVGDDGRIVLDCWAGNGAVLAGHHHPRVFAAQQRHELNRRLGTAEPFLADAQVALAANLAELAPGGDALVSFYPSRQEALLAAMMLAQRRHAGKRPLIVNFSPEIPLIKHMVPLPYGEAGALALQLHLRKNGPRALLPGAILAEPLSVALGNRLPPAGFLKRLRRLADEFGLVLISDESRCGLGRTGALFASEHDGIVPDITVVGSGLGGGVADIVAVLLNRRMFARIVGQMKTITMPEDQRGCWGQTMLIGSAVLNALIDDGLIRNAGVVGQYLRQRLLELRQRHPQRLAAIHGRGLMIGIELRRSPAAIVARTAATLLFADHGIYAGSAQGNRHVLTVTPPLSFSRDEADQLVNALETILSYNYVSLLWRTSRANRTARISVMK